MSIANAMSVISAAKKDIKEANKVKVACEENAKRKATKAMAVAIYEMSSINKINVNVNTHQWGGLQGHGSKRRQ